MSGNPSKKKRTENCFSFIWILENFEFCPQKVTEMLISPTFIVDTIDRSKWSLWIYPRGKRSEGWISLLLHREGDSKGSDVIVVDFELALLASDGSELTSRTHSHAFLKNREIGFPYYKERQSVFAGRSLFLPQEALTIRCRIWKSIGDLQVRGKCIARTRIGAEKRTFDWKIPNFSSFNVGQKEFHRLLSISEDQLIMSLKFFLRKIRNQLAIAIVINFLPLDESIIFSRFKCSLVTTEGDFVDCGEHEIWFLPNAKKVEITLPLSTVAVMDKKTEYLKNDVLTLYCEQVFSPGFVMDAIESMSYNNSGSLMKNSITPESIETASVNKSNDETSALKLDISSMLKDDILCDVTLCVKSETISAHSFILSARSLVFRTMFQDDMKEQINKRIDIEDLKPDTVRRMLHYMYNDSLEDLQWETASDLYVAALKYKMMTLKEQCSSYLRTNLSLTNACSLLVLADLQQDKDLKSAVQDFIMKNDKCIINSNEWNLLMQDNVHLAAETMFLKFQK